MGSTPRFKHCQSRRRGAVLSSALVLAFSALAPSAFGEPGEEQYNFNPPSPGGNGGETTGGSTGSTGTPGTPAAPGSTAAPAEGATGSAGGGAADGNNRKSEAGSGKGDNRRGDLGTGVLLTSLDGPDESGAKASDEGLFSAVTDSLGIGVMPILLAAIAAIGVGGLSLALYRRRGSTQAEPNF